MYTKIEDSDNRFTAVTNATCEILEYFDNNYQIKKGFLG